MRRSSSVVSGGSCSTVQQQPGQQQQPPGRVHERAHMASTRPARMHGLLPALRRLLRQALQGRADAGAAPEGGALQVPRCDWGGDARHGPPTPPHAACPLPCRVPPQAQHVARPGDALLPGPQNQPEAVSAGAGGRACMRACSGVARAPTPAAHTGGRTPGLRVPKAKPGRDSVDIEIFGMSGVPAGLKPGDAAPGEHTHARLRARAHAHAPTAPMCMLACVPCAHTCPHAVRTHSRTHACPHAMRSRGRRRECRQEGPRGPRAGGAPLKRAPRAPAPPHGWLRRHGHGHDGSPRHATWERVRARWATAIRRLACGRAAVWFSCAAGWLARACCASGHGL